MMFFFFVVFMLFCWIWVRNGLVLNFGFGVIMVGFFFIFCVVFCLLFWGFLEFFCVLVENFIFFIVCVVFFCVVFFCVVFFCVVFLDFFEIIFFVLMLFFMVIFVVVIMRQVMSNLLKNMFWYGLLCVKLKNQGNDIWKVRVMWVIFGCIRGIFEYWCGVGE